jgi:hypothetical protein
MPDLSDYIGELHYNFGAKVWAARVRKGVDDAGVPNYVLEIESGGHRSIVGVFTTGKGLVKYVHHQVDKKFKGYTPTVDTLSGLADRMPGSLVPDCYRAVPGEEESSLLGRGFPKCQECAWRTRCSDKGVELVLSSLPEEDDEEIRLKKLRDYVAQKWGEYKPEDD